MRHCPPIGYVRSARSLNSPSDQLGLRALRGGALGHYCGRCMGLDADTPPAPQHNSADQEYALAIMGDLHLEPAQMPLFHEAQRQLVAAMSDGAGRLLPGARVVQLGDLGGYKHQPGEAHARGGAAADCRATA